MDPRHLFMDQRLRGVCAYCGAVPDTRDHVPPRVLLDEPYPSELPVVEACHDCNGSFFLDEQYLACFVETVLSGTVEPLAIGRARVRRMLSENAALASRIEGSRRRDKEGNLIWEPEIDRVRSIVVKLARGHAAYELYPQFDEPGEIGFAPLPVMSDDEIARFEGGGEGWLRGWPEIGSRAFVRACGKSPDGFEQRGDWVVVQPGRYRYAVDEVPFRVRMVLSEYLACQVVWE